MSRSVLDFGITKILSAGDDVVPTRVTNQTGTGMLVGTPAYMSPEQLLGEDPTISWDLWALAVIAYESLTGTMPFRSTSIGDWRRNIISGKFTPIRDHVRDVAQAWQAFFEECFSLDPAKRPSSIKDFCSKFEAACAPGVIP